MVHDQLANRFTQDTITELMAQFDGDGPEDPAQAAEYCKAFDEWIVERSVDGTLGEAELDGYRAQIWFMRGMLAERRGEIDDSMAFFRDSIERAERVGNVTRQIYGLRSIARSYEYAGMQAESNRCIFQALDLAEEQGDDRMIGMVQHALSALYEAQAAYEQLFESADRTREIAERIDDPHLLVRAYAALSLSCGFLDRGEEGLVWMNKALDLCATAGMQQSATMIKLNMIFLYQQCGRLDDAVSLAEEQLDVIAGLSPQHAAAIYVDVAEVNLAAGNPSTAAKMLARADDLTDGDLMKAHLLRYYTVAADLYETQGDAPRALEMMRRYVEHDREVRGREAQARLVTAERHFAAELAAKTEELHHLRTVELVEKNDQLAALNHQKDEILNVVAHDLRNPLAAAQMLSESLMIDVEQGIATDRHGQLASIRAATSEMGATIDTLLHLQKHRSPSVLAPVDEVVNRSLAWAEGPASKRQIDLREDVSSIDLEVDGALLRRSLDDVLWVGVQSVAPGGTISVALQPAGTGATITVTSRTVVSTPNDAALYIARRLVERMRGSITVDDSDGDVSTTVINLRGT